MLAKELSNRIIIDSHHSVLELHKLKYRNDFYVALTKTSSFFYGVDSSLPLDEAAKASSALRDAGRVTTYELSEKSLYAVWEAAQWPQDYKDPLDKVFPLEQRNKLFMLFPALNEYLEHKERYNSAAGVLWERKRKDS